MKFLTLGLFLGLTSLSYAQHDWLIHLDIPSFEFDKAREEGKPDLFKAASIKTNTSTLKLDLIIEKEGEKELLPEQGEGRELFNGKLLDLDDYLGVRAGLRINDQDINFLKLDYKKDEIPFYNEINFLNVEDFVFYQDNYLAHLTFWSLHADMFGLQIIYNNLRGECNNRFEGELDIVDACLNNSSFEPIVYQHKKLTDLEKSAMLLNDSFGLNFQLENARLTPNNITVDASNISARVGSLLVLADGLKMDCYKGIFTEEVNDLEIVKSCLARGQIKVPKLEITDDDLKLYGEVAIEDFKSDDKFINFKTGKMDYKFEQSHISAKKISAKCKTAVLDINFEYTDIPYGCLKKSNFTMTDFLYEDLELSTTMANLTFDISKDDKDEVVLDSPKINITMLTGDPILDAENREELGITISNANISCDKKKMEDASFNSVLEGCFDSSNIQVGSVDITHPAIESTITVNEISIHDNILAFKSPEGSYTLDEEINHYEGFALNCNLNTSYNEAVKESLKDTIGSWKKLLNNCIHSLDINLDSLKSSYNGTDIWPTLESMGYGFIIQSVAGLKFNTSEHDNNKFKLFISPKMLKIVDPELEVDGTIDFNPNTNQIIIDIKHVTSSTWIGDYLSITDAIMWILDKALEDDVTDVNEEDRIITIQLPEDEEEPAEQDIPVEVEEHSEESND